MRAGSRIRRRGPLCMPTPSASAGDSFLYSLWEPQLSKWELLRDCAPGRLDHWGEIGNEILVEFTDELADPGFRMGEYEFHGT